MILVNGECHNAAIQFCVQAPQPVFSVLSGSESLDFKFVSVLFPHHMSMPGRDLDPELINTKAYLKVS